YLHKQPDGTWVTSIVARAADGYFASDGERGTGFAPYLRFDSQGRPNIIFSDHASQHFAVTGQNEFCGQIRQAVLSGGNWKIRTVYRQTNPLAHEIIYPAFAISLSEAAFVAIDRQLSLGPDLWPRS